MKRIFLAVFLVFFLLSFSSFTWAEESSFLIWPVKGEVILHFGEKYNLDGSEKTHYGIDIQAQAGEVVVAAASGIVSFVGFTPAGGDDSSVKNTVSIEHLNGLKTTYLQLDQIVVAKGQEVKQGEKIGVIAFSGDKSSSLSHLHFGLRKVATYLNPEDYLPPLVNEPLEETKEQPEPIEKLGETLFLTKESASVVNDVEEVLFELEKGAETFSSYSEEKGESLIEGSTPLLVGQVKNSPDLATSFFNSFRGNNLISGVSFSSFVSEKKEEPKKITNQELEARQNVKVLKETVSKKAPEPPKESNLHSSKVLRNLNKAQSLRSKNSFKPQEALILKPNSFSPFPTLPFPLTNIKDFQERTIFKFGVQAFQPKEKGIVLKEARKSRKSAFDIKPIEESFLFLGSFIGLLLTLSLSLFSKFKILHHFKFI